mmetsp:Transcript_4896/g.14953  ORF Transcript_4896/g.14953 Transcript_4896/m.14953 type:complete len:831 (-) Transcript_4896:77-2569(-)
MADLTHLGSSRCDCSNLPTTQKMRTKKTKKSLRNQRPVAVQKTNDESSVSKVSAAKLGYFGENPFLMHHFVSRKARRSPLVNRGYWLRVNSVRCILRQWFSDSAPDEKSRLAGRQVLSVGAGYDDSFFALRAEGLLSERDTYVELDFENVVRAKRAVIESTAELSELLGEKTGEAVPTVDSLSHIPCASRSTPAADTVTTVATTALGSSETFGGGPGTRRSHAIHTSQYHLMSCDIRDLKQLYSSLVQSGILCLQKPLLVLAECVFHYIRPLDSNRFLSWCLSTFAERGVHVFAFEQTAPHGETDAFASVMLRTLSDRSSPLLGLAQYAHGPAQRDRFTALHFECCEVRTGAQMWRALVASERLRIQLLEPFDEDAEWVEAGNHYCFVLASSSVASARTPLHLIADEPATDPALAVAPTASTDRLSAKPLGGLGIGGRHALSAIHRWGHSSVQLPRSNIALVFGGNHSARSDELLRFSLEDGSCALVEKQAGSRPSARVFHSAVLMPTTAHGLAMVVFGGRAGPTKPRNDVHLFVPTHDECLAGTWHQLEFDTDTATPTPRWKHDAVLLEVDQRAMMCVFGGRLDLARVTEELWLLDAASLEWTRLCSTGAEECWPAARCSHTLTQLSPTRALLYGGQTAAGELLNDVWLIELHIDGTDQCVTAHWKDLSVRLAHPLPAIFAHAAVAVAPSQSTAISSAAPGWFSEVYISGGSTERGTNARSLLCLRVGEEDVPPVGSSSGPSLHWRPLDVHLSQCALLLHHRMHSLVISSDQAEPRQRADCSSIESVSSGADEAADATSHPIRLCTVGGGGNCFAFGSFWDPPITIERS